MLDFDLHLKFATILFNYKHILITNYLGCPRIIANLSLDEFEELLIKIKLETQLKYS